MLLSETFRVRGGGLAADAGDPDPVRVRPASVDGVHPGGHVGLAYRAPADLVESWAVTVPMLTGRRFRGVLGDHR